MMTYNGFIISPHKLSPSLYVVATEGRGGKVPNILSGSFTTLKTAQSVIDSYVESQGEKTSVRKTNPTK